MNALNSVQQYGRTVKTWTFMIDRKELNPALRRFFVFCQPTVSTFAKPLKTNPQTKALQKSLLFPPHKELNATFHS
ncbi:hypothetical protein ES705_30477 [subsurface metagenome]